MKSIRCHGEEGRYHHTSIGINARFDTIQAAVLLAKLEVFSEELAQRQKIAQFYTQRLSRQFITPYVEPHNMSTYAQYTIQVADRDFVRAALAEQGIPTAVHYPELLNRQMALQSSHLPAGSYPHAEVAADRVLSLPFHPYLSEAMMTQLTDELLGLLSRKRAHA